MLGITVPEFVGVATVILAAAAAWKGTRAAEMAKGKAPPPEASVSIGAAVFADTLMMQKLVMSLDRIGDLIEAHNDAESAREKDRTARALEALVQRLDQNERESERRRQR